RRVLNRRLVSPRDVGQQRDLGMLAPGDVEAVMIATNSTSPLPVAKLNKTAGEITTTIAGLTIRLQRDPFAISISCEDVPTASVETALDDRNVHGLLCTPPPGVLMSAQNAPEAFWWWP